MQILVHIVHPKLVKRCNKTKVNSEIYSKKEKKKGFSEIELTFKKSKACFLAFF